MKAKFENQVFTFKTDIPETFRTELPLEVKGKDGEVVYQIDVDDIPQLSKFGIKCNAVIDGCLAVQAVLPYGVALEDVKKKYGLALIAANAYIPVALDAKAQELEVIDACFESATPVEEEA